MKYSLIFVALIIISSCNMDNEGSKLSPAQLMLELSSNQRFASPDQVAHWLIDGDPSLRLIDVRTAEEFGKFSLPKSVNIPLADLLKPEFKDMLDCEKYFLVFLSNDDMSSEQAWILNRQNGCSNSFILKGGLNAWTETIMKVQEPGDLASSEEIELFEFRKAAQQYFIGGSKAMEAEVFQPEVAPITEKKKIAVQPKKKPVVEEEEGC